MGKVLASALLVLLVIAGCTKQQEQPAENRFFDVKGFFTAEAGRLNQQKAFSEKTAIKDGRAETKKIRVDDWKTELDPFLASDINKSSWRNSYRSTSAADSVVYDALEDDLRTRRIVVRKGAAGRVTAVKIENRTSNALFSSSESLVYIPDSTYQITKTLDVRLIGRNDYLISGKINQGKDK
jgi:hypothetical protein